MTNPKHPFDAVTIESLQARHNIKWKKYPEEILPLWVADMDFPTSEIIVEAMVDEARGNNLVYPAYEGIPGLSESIMKRQQERHNWHFDAEDIWLVHGVVPSMFLTSMACASAGDGIIMQTPIYPPFMMSVNNTNRKLISDPMVWTGSKYEMDFEAFEARITPETRVLMLCNPHNPTGRVFTREELEKLGEIALRHRLWVLSDELHSDLVFDGQEHIPFASLSDEIAQRTITIFGPSKTFNLAGLKIGILVTQNKSLMQRLKDVGNGLLMAPNVLAQRATIAAYEECGDWLDSTMSYLDDNRQTIADFMKTELPMLPYATPEGTYLSWLDFRPLQLGDRLENILLDECKLGLNLGTSYGEGGEGFARINFATSKEVLHEGLTRLKNGMKNYVD